MAENLSLKQLINKINKNFDTEKPAAVVGVEDVRDHGTLSFGTPGLDYCLYNSLPTRRIIELSGKEGSGKTSVAFMICANYAKKELEQHPDNPRSILYVDLECAVDPMWAEKMGYDMSPEAKVPTICFRPLDTPGEDILTYVRDFIKTGEIGMVIIDSIPMLVGQQIYGEAFEKKEMGGIAKLLTAFVAQVTSLLVKYDCTLIGINQLRDNIGGYGLPYTTPGGQAWKYGCSVRLMLKRGSFIDEDGNAVTNSAESPAGYILECAVLKTKVSKWNRKVGQTVLSYTRGIDVVQDTIDIGIHLGLIDNSVQGSFKIIDLETGEIMKDSDGEEVKIRGKKNLKPYFNEHPQVFKVLYDKVYEMISKKDDPFISDFEKLMNEKMSEDLSFVSSNGVEEL